MIPTSVNQGTAVPFSIDLLRRLRVLACGALLGVLTGPGMLRAEEKPQAPHAAETKAVQSLFDGKTPGHWERADFGKEGQVLVRDGMLVMERGSPINGVIWKGPPIPQSNYELTLEAQRIEGSDFFATVTFPVKTSACSFVLGGWGGGLIGLSSLDGIDASENETLGYTEFENGKWYKIHIRVADDHIDCWIDGKQVVDVDTTDKTVDIRIEMEFCRPFGIATYRTTGAVRNIELKKIEPKK